LVGCFQLIAKNKGFSVDLKGCTHQIGTGSIKGYKKDVKKSKER
jgi:hypothetical protein